MSQPHASQDLPPESADAAAAHFARGNGLLSTRSVFKPRSAVCLAGSHRPGPADHHNRPVRPSGLVQINRCRAQSCRILDRWRLFRRGPRFVQDRAGTSRGVKAHAHVGLHWRSSRHGQRGCKTALSRPLRRATPAFHRVKTRPAPIGVRRREPREIATESGIPAKPANSRPPAPQIIDDDQLSRGRRHLRQEGDRIFFVQMVQKRET